MADEPTGEPTAELETAAPAAADQPAAEPAPERDWESLLNEAPDEVLAKHRRVQGIAGSHADRLYQRRQQESEQERAAEAARKAREDLEAMARDRPLEFSEMFLSTTEADKARERIAAVERNAAKQIMEQIGAAYHGLPEWTDLSDTEKAKLQEAIAGVPDKDVLPRFNQAALNLVADRRAAKQLADRLPKEQEAWRKQWEAERLAGESGPDLRRPSSTTPRRLNWSAMSDEDFNKYWKQRYG